MAGVSQYSNLTLFIYNGAVVDELHNSFDACTYCDDFYAYAYYKNIVCKSWDGSQVNEFKSVYGVESLEIFDSKLYAKTYCTYNGEEWRNEDWEYDCNGTEVYDPLSGERLSMFDPSAYKTEYVDWKNGFSITGQMTAQIIDGEIRVFATEFKLYLLEGDDFNYQCDFEDSAVDWTYVTPEVRGDYIIFGGCGEEDGKFVTNKKCCFNLKTRSFEDNPELPPVIRAEYGEYYFYVDYFEPINITATRYTELHRVNKLTGEDDIMAYSVIDYEDYKIDIVRDY